MPQLRNGDPGTWGLFRVCGDHVRKCVESQIMEPDEHCKRNDALCPPGRLGNRGRERVEDLPKVTLLSSAMRI